MGNTKPSVKQALLRSSCLLHLLACQQFIFLANILIDSGSSINIGVIAAWCA